MAPHSSVIARRISWTEEPGGLQSRSLKESDTTEHAYTCGPKLAHLGLPEIARNAAHSPSVLCLECTVSLFFQLEDNFFAILGCLLPYINMAPPQVYLRALHLEPLSPRPEGNGTKGTRKLLLLKVWSADQQFQKLVGNASSLAPPQTCV